MADPSSPYNSQHLYVLKSLAEVKTIVLLTDIPGANNLIQHLFTCCFDVLSGPSKAHSGEELSKNVEHHMTAVLATMVDEAQGLPAEVIDVVLAQFLRADPRAITTKAKGKGTEQQVDDRQSTLLMKEAPPAYNMAKNICNSCPEKMARYVSHYFSSVIVDASANSAAANGTSKKGRGRNSDAVVEEDEGPNTISEEELHETRKAHRLLRELWRSTPSVLQDIIPQLEMELGAEDVELRKLATETLGDMVAGIGAAGPPPPPTFNPAAYPSQSVSSSDRASVYNFLTTPNSPHSFPSLHGQTYVAFVSRKNDRSPIIRAAWTTGVGRILMTSAGGVGLDSEEEQQLLKSFSDMLVDGDERVRLAAIKAIEQFSYHDIVQKLGSRGGVNEPGSILANLGDRAKDKKVNVRLEAMKLLGNIWGVGFGAIAEGSERTSTLLGAIPSRILDTIYVNDHPTTVMVDRVLFESFLPLSYPPIKPKATSGGASQKTKESQADGDLESEAEIDKLRAERELLLVKSLETRAKTALFHREGQGNTYIKFWSTFIKACEDYNGGVMESNDAEIKKRLGNAIEYATRLLPEPSRVSDDLWKFAKTHDRRNYQLIRFCLAPESDYRKVYKAFKELTKRVEDASTATSTLKDTLMPLILRASVLLYNKSHIPSIIEYSRSDEKGLSSTAHEVLKMISLQKPQVFKAHVEQLCRSLEAEAPTAKKSNSPGAFEDLKACAGFARSFPEDVPKDRKFIQSMLSFALYGTPPKAAKYGVSILMTGTDKKDMHAKDILQQCTKGFKYGGNHYLAKLAALSQLVLVGSKNIEDEVDPIIDIAINGVLLRPQGTPAKAGNEQEEKTEPVWTDEIDDDCAAKIWALKILVNRLRALSDQESIEEIAAPVYKLLNTLVAKDGELSKKTKTPPEHRSRLKLTAAQLLLKLSTLKKFDQLITPQNFNQLALVAHDPLPSVRSGFIKKLQKYLGNDRLPRRYYAIVFLLAFEPSVALRENTMTWLRSRASLFAKLKDTAMEALLARFLSLLAHHPDFDTEVENLKDTVSYILFYLKAVATSENISLIYHVAQRVKSVQDGIDPAASSNLYCLSDLAQAVIQRYADAHDWPLQAWPGKLKMPSGLFAALPNHEVSQEIATKSYVPEELVDKLEDIVKASIKSKKVSYLKALVFHFTLQITRLIRREPYREKQSQLPHLERSEAKPMVPELTPKQAQCAKLKFLRRRSPRVRAAPHHPVISAGAAVPQAERVTLKRTVTKREIKPVPQMMMKRMLIWMMRPSQTSQKQSQRRKKRKKRKRKKSRSRLQNPLKRGRGRLLPPKSNLLLQRKLLPL